MGSNLENHIEFGDAREVLKLWKHQGVKVQTCITSPPYFGLRDYGVEGQLGLEQTPDEYVANMVEVFRCVRDILADDGTLWLNLGDSYAGGKTGRADANRINVDGFHGGNEWKDQTFNQRKPPPGLKPKDLIGIPWRVAFALQADGWYLRQDIIWHKPNPMPESVTDRCTKAHEYLFLLSKSAQYYYDHDAVREPVAESTIRIHSSPGVKSRSGLWKLEANRDRADGLSKTLINGMGRNLSSRNRRSVWTITPKPYKGAHFATFPPALIEPCILAGSKPGDIVLDPFMGSGTTAMVAVQHGRRYLGVELNPAYKELQDERIAKGK